MITALTLVTLSFARSDKKDAPRISITARLIADLLQTAGATQNDVIWQLADGPILPGHTYRVAINDFLLSGRETNLDYLTLDHPSITKIADHGDIRMAAIEELRRRYR